MSQPHQWKEEIILVLEKLGGSAHYDDIYSLIEERNYMNLSNSWKSVVRGCIERFSSDSDVYIEGNDDLFFSVYGKGNGVWGLRNYNPSEENVNLDDDDRNFFEGRKRKREHIVRERNPRVIKIAKERFKNINGELYCEVCKFSFSDKYGEIGEGFIEGHHIIPISEMGENNTTDPEDIVLLCSNCHRMVHRKRPWLERSELENIIQEQE